MGEQALAVRGLGQLLVVQQVQTDQFQGVGQLTDGLAGGAGFQGPHVIAVLAKQADAFPETLLLAALSRHDELFGLPGIVLDTLIAAQVLFQIPLLGVESGDLVLDLLGGFFLVDREGEDVVAIVVTTAELAGHQVGADTSIFNVRIQDQLAKGHGVDRVLPERKLSSTSAVNLVMTIVPAMVRVPRAMPLGLM